MEQFPNVQKIVERCEQLEAFRAADPLSQPDCPDDLKQKQFQYRQHLIPLQAAKITGTIKFVESFHFSYILKSLKINTLLNASYL